MRPKIERAAAKLLSRFAVPGVSELEHADGVEFQEVVAFPAAVQVQIESKSLPIRKAWQEDFWPIALIYAKRENPLKIRLPSQPLLSWVSWRRTGCRQAPVQTASHTWR